MKKILLMTAIMALVFTTVQTNAQIVQRTDRRMIQDNRYNRVTAYEMREVNQMKRQLQRTIVMAKADGIVTFREKQVIERKKRELDRMIYRQQNRGYIRR